MLDKESFTGFGDLVILKKIFESNPLSFPCIISILYEALKLEREPMGKALLGRSSMMRVPVKLHVWLLPVFDSVYEAE